MRTHESSCGLLGQRIRLALSGLRPLALDMRVKPLKGFSSHALRAEFPELKRRLPSLWMNSYFVSTTGDVTLETLKRYVENQKGK